VQLHYFDFVPPSRWNGFRIGRQVRLCPPDTPPAEAKNFIVVSPLFPRAPGLPSAETLFDQALAFELQNTQAKLVRKNGPVPTKSDHGLAGIYFEATVEKPDHVENRLYVMLADDLCNYGLSYAGWTDVFDKYVDDFWTSVRTIKPFIGRLVMPAGKPFDHFGE
jgi:hypothetical protein